MASIRSSRNRTTEMALVSAFRRLGVKGWRRHANLPGKPDFVFQEFKLAVFVDGCFWHRCPIHGTQPKGNRSFWKKKFVRNQFRARLVDRTLRLAGWRVLRIWEHELVRKNEVRLLSRIQRVLSRKTPMSA